MNTLEKLKEIVGLSTNVKYCPEPPGQDTWQTPKETLMLESGDCEDFAILHFYNLTKQGWPIEDLSFIYGKRAGQPHVILQACCDDGYWYTVDIHEVVSTDEYYMDVQGFTQGLSVDYTSPNWSADSVARFTEKISSLEKALCLE